jgi:hypothetical protein
MEEVTFIVGHRKGKVILQSEGVDRDPALKESLTKLQLEKISMILTKDQWKQLHQMLQHSLRPESFSWTANQARQIAALILGAADQVDGVEGG